MPSRPPKVSVIMAMHNAGAHLAPAIASVRAQMLDDFELILSDDGSEDDSRRQAEMAAAKDDRLQVISGPSGGPGAARNRALDHARGDWIAIVDADDLLHPARLARLVAQAEALGADMIADDLVHFGAETGRSLLQPLALEAPWWVGPRDLLSAETGDPPVPLGYLKPLIRRDVIGTMRYRAELRIGEDFDFLLRLTLMGARLVVLPQAYYLYRRHSRSISHRLPESAARAMIDAQDALTDSGLAPELSALMAARRGRLQAEADFAGLVDRLKSGRIGAAAGMLVASPALLGQLWRSFSEGRQRADADRATSPGDILLSAEMEGQPGGRRLPARVEDWHLDDVLAVVAAGNSGAAQIDARGHAGLEALGYIPGWGHARITPPPSGWTKAEQRWMARAPWPLEMVGQDAPKARA